MEVNNIEEAIAKLKEQIANTKHEPTRRALEASLSRMYEQQRQSAPYDKMGELSGNLLDFNSDYYKQYQSFLQKTTPGMGVNSLLAPLIAGGMGYAGAQGIAQQKSQEFNRERQDKINTGVQSFALGNINTGAGLLGQQGQLGLGYAQLGEQKRQYDDQNSGWNQFFGMLGQGAGLLPGLFGGSGGGANAMKPVAGYGG